MSSRSGIPGIPLLQRTSRYLEAVAEHLCYADEVDFELMARTKCVVEDWTYHSVCSQNPAHRAVCFLKGSDQKSYFSPLEFCYQTDSNLSRQCRDRLELKHWTIRVTQIRFGMWLVQLWRGDKSVHQTPDVETMACFAAAAETAAWLKARARELSLSPEEKVLENA